MVVYLKTTHQTSLFPFKNLGTLDFQHALHEGTTSHKNESQNKYMIIKNSLNSH